MNTQKTYYAPYVHAMTGLSASTNFLHPSFDAENLSFGVSAIDAPLQLPMGGVSVLYETDDFVMAKDFVSVRAS